MSVATDYITRPCGYQHMAGCRAWVQRAPGRYGWCNEVEPATTTRAYNGPDLPCNLTDRNPGTLTGLPTCCRVHRREATQARISAQGCPCNPHRPLRSCTNHRGGL